MVEIKFRAWSLINERWVQPTSQYEIGEKSFLRVGGFRDGVEVMQFTGLYDKNGKEIYEGDIIEDNLGTRYICHLLEPDKIIRQPKSNSNFFKWNKIIGNIYENPELLK